MSIEGRLNEDNAMFNATRVIRHDRRDVSLDNIGVVSEYPGNPLQGALRHPAASSGALREKADAIPYDLVPFQEITEAYSRVAEFGAKKYAAWNWSLGLSRAQLICSLLRHAFAYLRGEERDKDSKLLHTDHILWNAAALSHNVHWKLEDGRRVEPPRSYKEG